MPGLSAKVNAAAPGATATNSSGSEKNRPFVATLDMRTKIFISVAATLVSIPMNDWRVLAVVNFLTFVYVLNLRRIKPVLAMYAAVTLMLGAAFLFIPAFGWSLGALANFLPEPLGSGFARLGEVLSMRAFGSILLPFMRISVSMNVFLALGLTFDNQEFVAVMRKLRLPRIVFIPLMVCCRFIPSFVNDIRQLYESLKIRRKKMNLLRLAFSPLTVLRFIVIPVCVRTLNIADNLVLMCEVRRVGCSNRCICASKHEMRSRDWAVIASVIACVFALIAFKLSLPPPPETFSHH